MIQNALHYFESIPKNTPQGHWHSLWFLPEGEQRKQYEALLKGFQGIFVSPPFVPHMTFVGTLTHDRVKILEQTEEIASKHKPFTVKLGQFVSEDNYFRPIVAYGDEPEELKKLHTYAKEALKWNYPTFRPHVSMFYGNVPDSVKKALIEELGGALDSEYHVPGITVFDSKITEKIWEPIGYFPFKG